MSQVECTEMMRLIDEVQSAWDQYNVQLSLPDGEGRLPQYVSDRPNAIDAPQARRDAAVLGAAWNELERSLLQLSDAAARLRAGQPRPVTTLDFCDHRTGTFSEV